MQAWNLLLLDTFVWFGNMNHIILYPALSAKHLSKLGDMKGIEEIQA